MFKSLKKIFQKSPKDKEESQYDFTCEFCGETVNAMEQSGICPHIPIKEFIYGKENNTGTKKYKK